MSIDEEKIEAQKQAFVTTRNTRMRFFADESWFHMVFGDADPLEAEATEQVLNVSSCDRMMRPWHCLLDPTSSHLLQISLPLGLLENPQLMPTLGLNASAWGLVATIQLSPAPSTSASLLALHPKVYCRMIDDTPDSFASAILIDNPELTFPPHSPPGPAG